MAATRFKLHRPEGVYEAESAEGLAAIVSALGLVLGAAAVASAVAKSADPGPSEPGRTWHEHLMDDELDPGEAWATFVSLVWGKQLDLLRALKSSSTPLSTSDIRRILKAPSNNAVAGYISGGVIKNVRKAGLKTDDVLVIERVGGAKSYRAGPLLLANALPEPATEAT